MRENVYQARLIKKLKELFGEECVVLKNDPTYLQGVPDILILCGDRWAMLEVKMSDSAKEQPNQPYYIEMFGRMSFASFINPETEESVLNELQRSLRPRRKTRIPQPQ